MESGRKPCLSAGHRHAPGEAAAAVAHVEDDAALAPLEHSRIDVAGFVELVAQAGIAVRVDVARAQLLGQQLGDGALRPVGSEIDHHGNVGDRARFHGVLHRGPLGSGVVRRLDADDEALVAQRHLRRGRGLHVG